MEDRVVVDSSELRALARAARTASKSVTTVKGRAANIMSGLDTRGWDAGAAESAWSSARGAMTTLSSNLDKRAGDLDFRADLVDEFENGHYSGTVPFGFPIKDPVNSFSGNLGHAETDLVLPTRGGLGLLFGRAHNSRDPRRGLFGPGWTCSLEWKLTQHPDGFVVVRAADGRRDRFDLAPDGSYVGDFGVRHHLQALADGRWQLTLSGRRVLLFFDGQGELEAIADRNDNRQHIERDLAGRPARLSDTTGRSVEIDYDAEGLPRAARDSAGRQVSYSFDAAGRLAGVSDPAGVTTQYAYDVGGRLATIVDGLGNAVLTNRYDAHGRVVEQVDATGAVSRFDYDSPEPGITLLTDARGGTLRIEHDTRGQVVRLVDALGGELLYTYTACGSRESMRDRNGQLWRWEFAGGCRPVATIDPLGSVERLTYDAEDRLLARTDALGNTWRFEYDERGNLIASVDPSGARTEAEVNRYGQLIRLVDPDGVWTHYDYDEVGNLVQIASPAGVMRMTCDAAGRRVSSTDANGYTETATYDAASRFASVTDALGRTSRVDRDATANIVRVVYPDGATMSFDYDAAGRTVRLTDPLGAQMTYGYDANGNRTEIVDPTGATARLSYDVLDRAVSLTDPLGGTWHRSFDAEGHVIEETDPSGNSMRLSYDARGALETVVDAVGSTTRLGYNAVGQRVSVEDGVGATTRFEYDVVGRLIAQVNALGGRDGWQHTAAGRLAALVDPLDRRLTFAYDAAGRFIAATDPIGARLTYAYDAAGNVVAQTDRAGATTTYAFDAAGRTTATVDALGQETRYTYDVGNNLVAIENAAGRTTRYEYDAAGRLTVVTDPLGGVTRYAYDVRGGLVARTDANGHTTHYTYDANNRLIALADPLGRTTELDLGPTGRPVRTRYPDGSTLTTAFDARGNLVSADGPDGWRLQFEFDALGRATTMRDELGETRVAFDALGRLESVDDPFHQVTSFAYDVLGNRTGLTYPSSHTVRYAFDERDRVASVTDWLGGESRFEYDAVGRLVAARFANGAQTKAVRDALGHVLELSHTSPSGAPLASFSYRYDALGNLVSEGERTYAYDALSRLTAAGSTGFTYDAVGNRLSIALPDGTIRQARYDAADQLLQFDGTPFTYDSRGNVVTAGPAHYSWDITGNLRSVVGADGSETRYDYDGLGNLHAEHRPGADRQFTLDVGAPLPEVLSIVDSTEFVYGPVRIGAFATEPRYYLSDARGSVRAVLDSSGDLAAEQSFDAWGIPARGLDEPFGFTGELQPDGLMYLRARWYEPSTGRFLGPDPFAGFAGDPIGQHPYLYANANPTTLKDPTGYAAARALFAIDMPMPNEIGAGETSEGGLPPWARWLAPHPMFPGVPEWLGPANPWDPILGGGIFLNEVVKGNIPSLDAIKGLYTQARTAWDRAAGFGAQADKYFADAMNPSKSLFWRMPGARNLRSWGLNFLGRNSQSLADSFTVEGNRANAAAEALEGKRSTLSTVTKWGNRGLFALDALSSGWGQWVEDTENGVDTKTKIVDTATTGVYHAALAYGVGAGAAAGCAAVPVLDLATPLCAVAGSYVGGKIADYTAPYVNKAANFLVDTQLKIWDTEYHVAKSVVSTGLHAAGDAAGWAEDHLCPFC